MPTNNVGEAEFDALEGAFRDWVDGALDRKRRPCGDE
jgi:hypothetical protein